MNIIFPDDVRFAYQNPKDLILQVHHRILERAFGVENGEPVPAWHEVSNSFAYMVSQANESPIARQWVMMVFVNLEPSRRQSLFRDFRLCIDQGQHFPHSRSPEAFLFQKAYRFFHPRNLPLPMENFIPTFPRNCQSIDE